MVGSFALQLVFIVGHETRLCFSYVVMRMHLGGAAHLSGYAPRMSLLPTNATGQL
jgi:hypothetical protein